MPTPPFELPETFADYHLNSLLADGRMGRVYKAKAFGVEGFEKNLCVKLIEPGLTEEPEFVDVLIEEAKRAVTLSHANVVQVYDLGREDESGVLYIAEEYVNGLDLGRALEMAERSDYPWPRDLSLYVTSEIGKALDYAHRRKDLNFNNLNILHGGLAPDAVLLSNGGEVKVTDFGISRALEALPPPRRRDDHTRFLYAAPEYARNFEASRTSDLFSLGLIAYEMLTGRHPYRARDRPARELAREADIPPIGRQIDLDEHIAALVDSMLVPDPAGRVDSAGDIHEALISYLFEENLSSDDRALATFLDELRAREEEWEPTETPGAEALDELAPEAVRDFVERSSDSFQPPDRWIRELDEPHGGDQPPTARLDDVDLEASSEEATPELPEPLEARLERTRGGSGGGVLLSGQFGNGIHYLPDRLIEVLERQPETRLASLHAADTDAYRPFGGLGDLLLRMLQPSIPERAELVRGGLDHLSELDVPSRAIETLEALWAPSTPGRIRYRGLLDDLSTLFVAAASDLARREPLVLVVEHPERFDEGTLEVLHRSIDALADQAVLVVLATGAAEALQPRFAPLESDQLTALRLSAPHSEHHADLSGLSSEAERVLLPLALAERPLSHWDVAEVQSMSEEDVADAAEELLAADLLRSPKPGMLMADVSDTSDALSKYVGDEEIASVAARLVQRLERTPQGRATWRMPECIRLDAMARNRPAVEARARTYASWLEDNEWLEIAMDFHGYCDRLSARHKLGDPSARRGHLLRGAELALELGAIDEARSHLDRAEALPTKSRDERAFARTELLLGELALHEDALPDARDHVQRVLKSASGLRDRAFAARAHLAAARWFHRFGNGSRARHHLERALHLEEHARRPATFEVLAALWRFAVRLFAERGWLRRSARATDKLETLAERSGWTRIEARARLARATLEAERGAGGEASEQLDRSRGALYRRNIDAPADAMTRLQAKLALELERFDEAEALADALLERTSAPLVESEATSIRAVARCRLGGADTDEALDQLESGLERARRRDVPRDLHRTHRRLAVALDGRDPERAARHRRAADEWLEDIRGRAARGGG